MNHLSIRNLGLSLVLIGTLTACKDGAVPETASNAPDAVANSEPAPPASMPDAMPAPAMEAEQASAPTAIPDSADGIWLAINQHSGELKTMIASGQLKQVHHHAFAIRDLVAALPAASPTLPAEDKAKLESEVKFVTTLADRLDETGDTGDQAGSQANYDKLVTVLDAITRTK